MVALKDKRILLGITGGIAVYKSADLVRRLRDAGAQVRVVMTAAAQTLITPITFQALSGEKVLTDWQQPDSDFAMDHIALARWADLILVAPATADFIARLAHGFANDVLTTLCLAAKVPLVVAPAMNVQMWQNPATQANRQLLQAHGIQLLGPAAGSQACGDYGEGRMLEVVDIVGALPGYLCAQTWRGVSVMVTAGPTQEAIDPVRYVSNHSSGKMGYALAQAAAMRGAQVTLISGPTQLPCPYGVQRIAVITAQQMLAAVMTQVEQCRIFIAAAAVADYRCVDVAAQKMKKMADSLTLKLAKNPDILAAVAQLPNPPFTVGFAAETEHLSVNARRKLVEKKLDVIVANDVSQADIGFNSDHNAVSVFWKDGEEIFTRRSKLELAQDLLTRVEKLLGTAFPFRGFVG